MRRLALIILFLFISLTAVVRAQPAGQIAHGSEKVAHEVAHPEEPHGEGAEAPKTYFGIPGWILKLINMFVFLGVLGYLLGGPVKKFFEARRLQIGAELTEARVRREKADRLAADIAARLQQLERDVASILQKADEEGERQKREIIAASEAEAEKVLASARNAIEARVKSARTELAALAAETTTEQARALVAKSLTDADRKKIFGESIDQIEEIPS